MRPVSKPKQKSVRKSCGCSHRQCKSRPPNIRVASLEPGRADKPASHYPIPIGSYLSSGARSVRNWWLTLALDGSSRQPGVVQTGPVGRDGGFSLQIFQRSSDSKANGDSVIAIKLYGYAHEDGTLRLSISDPVSGELERELMSICTTR